MKTDQTTSNASAGTQAQHTPGPWKIMGSCHVKPCGNGSFLHVAHVGLADDTARNPCVAEVLRRDDSTKTEGEALHADAEQEANARLIAAAPETAAERDRLKASNAELVAALQKIDANAAESVEWIRRVARSAIAKAGPTFPQTETAGRAGAEGKEVRAEA